MNRTVTSNIGGLIFNMEEEAFQKLKEYIDQIKEVLRNEKGFEEILQDIEARIAEILSERTQKRSLPVVVADVLHVIESMGTPHEFANGEAEGETLVNDVPRSKNRRLFRDPDGRILGGVCAGLGHYFGIDPVIMRLLFVAIVIFGGSGILLYLILWLVMPKATSAADRLSMKGEPINLESIKNMFRGEGTEDAQEAGRSLKFFLQKAGEFVVNILRMIVKALGRVFGVFLIIVAVTGFIVLSITYLGSTSGDLTLNMNQQTLTNLTFTDLSLWIFGSETALSWAMGFGLVLAGLPLLILLLSGLKLMFQSHGITAALLGLLTGLWLLTLLIFTALAFYKSEEVNTTAQISQPMSVLKLSDTLVVRTDNSELAEMSPYSDYRDRFLQADSIQSVINDVQLFMGVSPNDSIRVFIKKSAKGKDIETATARASNIDYAYRIEDGELIINPTFRIYKEDMYRFQSVIIEVQLPENTTLYLHPSLREMLQNVPRSQKVRVKDMFGHYWNISGGQYHSPDF